MGIIYRLFRIETGKTYIGQTIYTLQRRFKQHVCSAYDPKSHCYNSHLQTAIRKYGKDAFAIEEIEQCNNDMLDERERYWIQHYDSVHNGYNMALGGDGTPRYKSEDILSAWNRGLTITQITKELNICGATATTHLMNCGISADEIRRRGYESIKGKVYKYYLNGDYAGEYATLADAMKQNKRGGINQAFDNPERSACGFLWSREKKDHIQPYKDKKKRKPVHQYTSEGIYIRSFESVSIAAKSINVTTSQISAVCNGKTHACYGYRWSFEKVDKLPKLKRKIIKWESKVS